jgi:hypothetical protein
MIFTLEIKLSGWRKEEDAWSVRVEVTDNFTLDELHATILRLVGFDNDHLHVFYAGRNWRNRRIAFGEPADTPYGFNEGEEVALGNVFPLPKGHKLFYHFDFGDDWLFEISRRLNAKQGDRNAEYPRLISENGRRPIQYPVIEDEG